MFPLLLHNQGMFFFIYFLLVLSTFECSKIIQKQWYDDLMRKFPKHSGTGLLSLNQKGHTKYNSEIHVHFSIEFITQTEMLIKFYTHGLVLLKPYNQYKLAI